MIARQQRLLPLRWRAAALLPAAVLSVHQLRFLLAFGGGANAELARSGHAYLGLLAPAVAMATAIAVGLFVARLAAAWQAGDAPRAAPAPAPFVRLWLTIAALLVAIYAGQEMLEGALAPAHDAGLAGAFGSGGLLALPAALLVAALVAALLRGADLALAWAARRLRGARSPLPPRPYLVAAPPLARPSPLASAAAGRAPPAG